MELQESCITFVMKLISMLNDLLKNISQCCPGKIITLVPDNAKRQKCRLVLLTAKKLKIKLLFLFPYLPNLNIIERLWKFIKKEFLNSKYYEKFQEFQAAIAEALEKSNGGLGTKVENFTCVKTPNVFHREQKERCIEEFNTKTKNSTFHCIATIPANRVVCQMENSLVFKKLYRFVKPTYENQQV